MRRLFALVVLVALAGAACGDDDSSEGVVERPPLASPPDPGPAPDDDGLSDALRERVAESTVRVAGIACGRTTEGSGFAVADQLVVTNAHVVQGLSAPTIETGDGDAHPGRVVAYDAVNDLAVVRVDTVSFEPLPLGTAPDGTIGAVFGWEAGPVVEPTPFRVDRPVTVRIEVVGGDERISRRSWLLAADIEAGDSGAAVVDNAGVVVGVAYATTSRTSSVAYAIRSEVVEELLAEGFNDNLAVPDC